jgi:hypothetical protein
MMFLLVQCVLNKSESIVSQLFLKLLGDSLDFVHDPQQIAAPEFFDLLFGITATNEFQGHIECFTGIVPTCYATSAVDGMRVFIRALLGFGIKPDEVKVMLKDNPAKLIWLD